MCTISNSKHVTVKLNNMYQIQVIQEIFAKITANMNSLKIWALYLFIFVKLLKTSEKSMEIEYFLD